MNKLTHFFKGAIERFLKKSGLKSKVEEYSKVINLVEEKKETEFDNFFKDFLKVGAFDSASKMIKEGYEMHENVKKDLDKTIFHVIEEISNHKSKVKPIIEFDRLSKSLSHEAFLKFMVDNNLINGNLIDMIFDGIRCRESYESEYLNVKYSIDIVTGNVNNCNSPDSGFIMSGMFPYLENECILLNQVLFKEMLSEEENLQIDGYPEYKKIGSNPFIHKLLNHPYLLGTKLFKENDPDITLEQAFEMTKKHINSFLDEDIRVLSSKLKIMPLSIMKIKENIQKYTGIESLPMVDLYSMYPIHQSLNAKIEEFGEGKLAYYKYLMNESNKDSKTKKAFQSLAKMILLESPERIFGKIPSEEIKKNHIHGYYPISLACVLDHVNISNEMLKKLEKVNQENPEKIDSKKVEAEVNVGPDINHVLSLLKKSKRENMGALNDVYEILDRHNLGDLEHDLKEVSTIIKELSNHQLNSESRNYINNVESEILAMFDTYNAIQDIDESGDVTSKEMLELPLKSIVMKLQDIKREILTEQIESLQKTVVVAKKVQVKR